MVSPLEKPIKLGHFVGGHFHIKSGMNDAIPIENLKPTYHLLYKTVSHPSQCLLPGKILTCALPVTCLYFE